MKFTKTSLADAMVIDMRRNEDSRGFFARSFCAKEFADAGLVNDFVQQNHSYNRQKGTVRGMHFQRAPHGEVKLVRCVKGGVIDIIIDLRADSPTYLKWEPFELNDENGRTLYVPTGFGHGFQTLADETHVLYSVSHPYTPGVEGGVRHDDPVFGIGWPLPVSVISEKDQDWPLVDLAQGIRILRPMPLPTFLIIGAAKAGTTSLYHYLRQHPDVFMPRLKEPRFFAYEGQPGRYFPVKTLKEYLALFDGVTTETVVGEASPDYLHIPVSAGRIRETIPDVRLIVSLRNPVDRAHSLYEMRQRDYSKNVGRSFREALETDPKLQQGYHEYLRAYLDLFDPSALKIVLFEDVTGNTAAIVRSLFEFIGASSDFRPNTSKISNPGGLPRSKALHALLNDRRVREVVRAALPKSVLERARIIRKVNLKKQEMLAEERARALDHFRDDILRTQDLIGRDLSAWLRI